MSPFTSPASRSQLSAVIMMAAALTLSACSSANSTPAPVSTPVASSSASLHSATSSPPASAQTQDVFTVAMGDCMQQSAAGAVTDVPTVPCATPHDLEDFYDFTLTGTDFPGETTVSAAAKAGCGAQFESFIGIAYADSALDYTELTPTEQSWASGDRTVSCLVGDPNGKTSGTLAGAAR